MQNIFGVTEKLQICRIMYTLTFYYYTIVKNATQTEQSFWGSLIERKTINGWKNKQNKHTHTHTHTHNHAIQFYTNFAIHADYVATTQAKKS